MRGRQFLSIALLAGVATLASAGQARALLQLSVFENGVFVTTYFDNLPGDDDPTAGRINVLPGTINPLIDVADFTALQATSNAGSDTENATLGQTADINNIAAGGGTLDVIANDTDYSVPADPQTMISTGSTSFTGATGDTRLFQSFFDPLNGVYTPGDGPTTPDGIPAPLITQILVGTNSDADTTSVDVADDDGLFALSNWTTITFTAGAGKEIRTSGITTVSGVPEPGTMALLLGGLPLLAVGAWRRRRSA